MTEYAFYLNPEKQLIGVIYHETEKKAREEFFKTSGAGWRSRKSQITIATIAEEIA